MTPIDLPAQKRVGHLTLLREPRPITAREFNALSAEERLTMISRAQGRQKYRLLLEAADVAELVPQLAAQELYLLIREQGFEEMADLLPLVSGEQFSLFLDLDCWDGDRFESGEFLRWLQALLDCGEDKTLETVRELDPELLVLSLKRELQVVATPGDMEDDEARLEAQRRDGGYQFEYFDAERAKPVAQLLDILFRGDPEFFRRLVEAVRWEQEAQLEEEAFHLHRGRLEDSGFPDPQAAQGLYAWLTVTQLQAQGQAKHPFVPAPGRVPNPGFFLAAARPRDLLAEVLGAGIDERTAWELGYLINKLMMAEQVDVGEPRQVQAAAESVYRHLNLALEELAGDDAARAGEALSSHYLEHLFRLGFSLTLRLQQRARTLAADPLADYLDSPFRSLLAALTRRRPAFFAGLEDGISAGERPFATRRDLQCSETWLDRLEVQLQLFQRHFSFTLPARADLDLDGCAPLAAEDVTLSTLFLTALANRLLGGEFLPLPIPLARLAELHAKVSADGRVAAALRTETVAWLEGLAPGAGSFGHYCLDRWEEEFCPLTGGDLDPRFLGGLIVRLTDAT